MDLSVELAQEELRHAENERVRWRAKADTAADEGQRRVAQAWISWYTTQIERYRTYLKQVRQASWST
jgi:hypothetical protein